MENLLLEHMKFGQKIWNSMTYQKQSIFWQLAQFFKNIFVFLILQPQILISFRLYLSPFCLLNPSPSPQIISPNTSTVNSLNYIPLNRDPTYSHISYNWRKNQQVRSPGLADAADPHVHEWAARRSADDNRYSFMVVKFNLETVCEVSISNISIFEHRTSLTYWVASSYSHLRHS